MYNICNTDSFHTVDIPECEASPCDPNAICMEGVGSFSCQCKSGFTGDGRMCDGKCLSTALFIETKPKH